MSDNINHTPSSQAVNYTFLIIYLVGLSAFGSFVNDMYLPSLPRMTRYFHCTIPMVQLGLTTGMIGLAVGQLVLGPVSDRYGRKPVLIYSLLLFCVASVTSIFSPTIHFFLVCRLVQGLGASGAYFLARTIPADFYSGRRLAQTMGVVGGINGFAPACSPVLGGFIADSFDWQGVFVALTAFAVILLLFSRKLKESLPQEKRTDGGLLRSFANYRNLLRDYPFMTHVLLKGTSLGLLFAYISSAPFIMQDHFGYSQTDFGLILGANALFCAAGAMTALRFKPLRNAATIAAIALLPVIALEAWFLAGDCSFWQYELPLLPMLFFLGMIFTVGNTLSMNEGRAFAGDASAVVGIVGYIFGAAVAPLVGIGDTMTSTAIVFIIQTILILAAAIMSARLKPDLEKDSSR